MKFKSIIWLISFVLFFAQSVLGFGLSSGRGVGMAQAYISAAKGTESAFWNPANLGFTKNQQRSWMIFSLSVNLYNNSFDLQQYNRYNGKFLTTEDKQKIWNAIPQEGFSLSADGDVLAFGVSEGRFAFTISGTGTSDLLIPKDPIYILFFGNKINDTILLSGWDGEAYAAINIGLSHGRSVWERKDSRLSCGITVRYVQGLIYQKVKQAQGELFTLETGVNGEGNFLVRSATGGRGYGVDLGLALEYKKEWTFGLSFINLINQTRWNRKTEEEGYQIKIDSLLAEEFDPDSMIVDHSYTKKINSFITRIPTLMRMGVAHQGKRLLLTFDLAQGFKEGMGVTKKLRVSGGAEYMVFSWLDVRGGISLGGDERTTLAQGLGFTLGSYHLDLGMSFQRGLWFTKSKGISLAFSNGFQF